MEPLGEGTRVGAYILVKPLGRGGMATVWEAEHAELKKRVALKILSPEVAKDLVAAGRFSREGRAAARVRHPNVVDVVDVGSHEGVPFLVLELVNGPTLSTLLAREAPLPIARVAELVLPLISAMKRAHAASVVHRDLKPANVLLANDLQGDVVPKIADFGISKILDPSEAELTREHGVVGTLLYMSPEQVRSAASADARSDQWALGVILYQASTGTLPFKGESSAELIQAILAAEVEPPSARKAGIPASFDALVMRALSKDPRDRFADMQALGVALLEHAQGRAWSTWAREMQNHDVAGSTLDEDLPREEPTHGPPLVRTAPGATRGSRALTIAAVLALLVAGGLTVRSLSRTSPPPVPSSAPAAPPAVITVVAPAPSPSIVESPASPTPSASTMKPKPPAVVAKPSASVKPKSPDLGSNGAPILE